MAKLLLGPLIADARNKFAGIVLQKGHYGAQAKRNTTPGSARTPRAATTRGVFSATAKQWLHALTQTQRDKWNQLAAAYPVPDVFNNLQSLSGIAFFIRVNGNIRTLRASNVFSTPYTQPPQIKNAPNDQNHSDCGSITVTYTPPPTFALWLSTTNALPSSDQLVVCASPPTSPGRKLPPVRSLRVIQVFRPGDTGPFDITLGYQAHNPSLPLSAGIAFAAYSCRPTNGAVGPKHAYLLLYP
jgi:hypothetical protein